jgi:hypothetical protein
MDGQGLRRRRKTHREEELKEKGQEELPYEKGDGEEI